MGISEEDIIRAKKTLIELMRPDAQWEAAKSPTNEDCNVFRQIIYFEDPEAAAAMWYAICDMYQYVEQSFFPYVEKECAGMPEDTEFLFTFAGELVIQDPRSGDFFTIANDADLHKSAGKRCNHIVIKHINTISGSEKVLADIARDTLEEMEFFDEFDGLEKFDYTVIPGNLDIHARQSLFIGVTPEGDKLTLEKITANSDETARAGIMFGNMSDFAAEMQQDLLIHEQMQL